MEVLGLLAGVGRLPVEVARSARKLGYQVVVIGVVPGVEAALRETADFYYEIHIGKLGKILAALKKHQVSKATMIGKVTKEILYSAGAVLPDWRAVRLLTALPDRRDDTIMNALVHELETENIEVMDQTILLKPLLPEAGVLSKRQPTQKEWADIDFGFLMAKEIGRLDIGQTVVVQNKAVLAVEAIEGTDACIRRGGKLGQAVVVVKTEKPQQDKRFDIPCIGTDTIQAMLESGAAGIAIEAGRTFLAEREETLALVDKYGLFLVVK